MFDMRKYLCRKKSAVSHPGSVSLEASNVERKSGFTLIEIIVSITLLAIIAFGTAQYMVYARWDIDRGIRKQLAWITMASRLEEAVDYGFETVADSLPETSTPLNISDLTAFRTTDVIGVDDSTDGLYPSDLSVPDYYQIKVYIAWFSADNVSDSVTAYLSEETSWDY